MSKKCCQPSCRPNCAATDKHLNYPPHLQKVFLKLFTFTRLSTQPSSCNDNLQKVNCGRGWGKSLFNRKNLWLLYTKPSLISTIRQSMISPPSPQTPASIRYILLRGTSPSRQSLPSLQLQWHAAKIATDSTFLQPLPDCRLKIPYIDQLRA